MDKLKKYNQYLLAIIGTICLVIALGGLLLMSIELFRIVRPNQSRIDGGIVSNQRVSEYLEDSLRSQIISFDYLTTIDSVKELFLLPVTQSNLARNETVSDLYNMSSGYEKKTLYGSYQQIYNNLVVHNAKDETSEIIFDQRVSIDDYMVYQKKYIIIKAAENDTNEDELMNSKDLQELFIYDIDNASIHKLPISDRFSLQYYFQDQKSPLLFARYGYDKNNDGEFNSNREPSVFYVVDVEKMTLKEMVSLEKMDALQKLLEGR